ncbi:sugar ABC transporter permease [Paenibacillus swuensis]|uniref:Sugar ABC transporter permease n=1 Tax=Paenibacillus swuensis TaxID=1178515 RepID=A0A172TND8_9BACL|nr:carbohydrate ABC transporter permease [Paenibacillus swuensis]ANE48492.1 sugar ABC transporter permease [Paenibacillus swuensis]
MNKLDRGLHPAVRFLVHVFFILYVAACIIPLILVFMVSLTEEKTLIANGYSLFPSQLSFDAYSYLFADFDGVVRAYGVTVFVTVVGTIVSLWFTSMFAYGLSRKSFQYRGFFAFVLLFTMLFNGGLVPWYILYSSVLNLTDTIWILIIPLLIVPFHVILMRTFFTLSVPDAIIESAKIDGAGEFRTFFAMIIPISLPVFATIGLFNTLLYWNDWFLSMVFITDERLVSLQYLMYKVMANIQYLQSNSELTASGQAGTILRDMPNESIRMAMVILGMGPILVAYPFFQKYFVKGLTVGAIKG